MENINYLTRTLHTVAQQRKDGDVLAGGFLGRW